MPRISLAERKIIEREAPDLDRLYAEIVLPKDKKNLKVTTATVAVHVGRNGKRKEQGP